MPGADKVIANMQEWERRTKAALFALGQHYGAKMEGEAKQEAPWTDRTGHARQGLFGEAMEESDALRVRIAHSMDYGPYLELAHSQKYAILEPVAKHNAPEFIRDAQEVIRR
ncbi:MAG: hypothetical protein HPY52_10785 [Firmicutes bacterium]|nr:hypothetical protein [Bacillota bacterium]